MEIYPGITVEPDKCGGKPCIRGHRLTVEHLLALLAEGATRDDLIREWDFLKLEDIEAALRFGEAQWYNDHKAAGSSQLDGRSE